MVYNTRTVNSKDEWETPQYFYNLLDEEFRFDIDPCASESNAKCKRWLSDYKEPWGRGWAFVNPPYKLKKEIIKEIIKKDYQAVVLIPSATETELFRIIWNHAIEIRFVQGRINFCLEGKVIKGNNLGSMLCVFDPYMKYLYKDPVVSLFYHKDSERGLSGQ